MAKHPKTIHLIRHGVALHNVPDAQTGERPNLLDPRYTDPPLIRQGELQAAVLGEQLRRNGLVAKRADLSASRESGGISKCEDMDIDSGEHDNNHGSGSNAGNKKCTQSSNHEPIELVVCSPLTRCLQTASHIFPSYFEKDSSASSTATTTIKDINNENAQHHSLDRNCRVCCHGDVREAYGMHYPDKRSPLSQLKSKFPTIAYHPLLAENDTDWQPDSRETRDDVVQRIHQFFVWLMHQPHTNIAIVTHGVWMECALLSYCPEVLEHGRKRVYNCDVYRGKLSLMESGLMDNEKSNDGDSSSGVYLRDVEKVVFYHV